MSVQIKVVESKRELKTFVRFANKLYKGNKYYVPSIVLDDLTTEINSPADCGEVYTRLINDREFPLISQFDWSRLE